MQDIVRKKMKGVISQTAVAEIIGVTPQTVSLWVKNGIPSKRVIQFCKATDWEITPHQVNPNHYPNPTDGLPPELQSTAVVNK